MPSSSTGVPPVVQSRLFAYDCLATVCTQLLIIFYDTSRTTRKSSTYLNNATEHRCLFPSNSLIRGDRPIVAPRRSSNRCPPLTNQMANKLSALDTIAGAVRVTRFDHSNMSSYDSTGINTEDFKMEYVVNFEGAGRPNDLPLMSFERLDSVDCGEKCCLLSSIVVFAGSF